MAIITYPLNNIEYTAEDAELYHATRTSGVFANDDFPITVSGADNVVKIGEGLGWIRNSKFSGKVVANKAEVSLDIGLPHATYPRIDAIVLRFSANINATEILVKMGTAKTNPVPPEVVRTESVYELHLYHVRRRAGSTSILSSDITDLRADDRYCGIMSDDVTIVGNDFVKKDQIGKANGVAPLGTNSKVPIANLPVSDSTTLNSSNSIATSAAVKAVKDAAPLTVTIDRNTSSVSAEDILIAMRAGRPVLFVNTSDGLNIPYNLGRHTSIYSSSTKKVYLYQLFHHENGLMKYIQYSIEGTEVKKGATWVFNMILE